MFNRIAAALLVTASIVGLASASSPQPTRAYQVDIAHIADLGRFDLGLLFPTMSSPELDRLAFAIADKSSMDLLEQSVAPATQSTKAAADRLLFAEADRHSVELLDETHGIVQAAR